VKERKDRVDDALNATRARLVEEGHRAGAGGVMLAEKRPRAITAEGE